MLETLGVVVVTMVNLLPLMIMTMTTFLTTAPAATKVSLYATYCHLPKWNKIEKYATNTQK